MNETLKVLETRRSCRNFDKERMVSEEDIQAVVKAGTYAATGMGRQSPIIIAVTNKTYHPISMTVPLSWEIL